MTQTARICNFRWHVAVATAIPLLLLIAGPSSAQSGSDVRQIPSKDGVPIAVECAGHGPTLLLVHGGTGDRTRWTPLFPLFVSRFAVCAMDRRGHGASGDSPNYNLQKEIDDVVAVVNALPAPVYVLGHSYGGVAALEAAFLVPRISRLILYEPPVLDRVAEPTLEQMRRLSRAERQEEALLVFFREVVKVSEVELTAMKSRPSWPALVPTIDLQIRQIRALNQYRFDAERVHRVMIPTLLLTGSKTTSASMKRGLQMLREALPRSEMKVFEDQEHNAMDAIPQQFADTVTDFLTPR